MGTRPGHQGEDGDEGGERVRRQMLAAETVRGVCSANGFLFADPGEFAAKRFEAPVRTFEVLAGGSLFWRARFFAAAQNDGWGHGWATGIPFEVVASRVVVLEG